MKAIVMGSDSRLGLELVAHLQGRDIPFVSISSRDPVIEGVKLLQHAFDIHGATHVINAMSRELFQGDDPVLHKRGLVGVKNLCKACRAQGSVMIHLSDDSMFHGRRSGAYREKDAPDNADPRAQRVLKGESYVTRRVPRHIVLRSGPLIASSGDNLFSRLVRHMEADERIEASADKLCPTPAADVARVVAAILLQLDCGAEPWGVYHYCSSDATSMYNFAEAIVALASQYGRIRRESVRLHELASRERNIILNCHNLLETFGIKQRPWRAALPSVVAEYCRAGA